MIMRRLSRRIAFRLLTAWAVVTVNFLIPRLMSGDPVQEALGRFQSRGIQLSRAAYGLEKIEHQLVVIPEFLRVAA